MGSTLVDTLGLDTGDGPFDSVPNEVLEQIFGYCIEKSCNSYQNTIDPSQPPWVLTRVNRRWRSISLASKNLWSNIIVQRGNYGSFGTWIVPRAKAALRLLLSRSNPLPLMIHFAPGDSVALMQAMKHLLPQMVSCSPRWRDVHFVFPSTVFLSSMNGIAGKLPLLERLHLHVHAVLHPVAERYDMFGTAPALTHATIEGFKRIDQVPLPFARLVEYNGPQEDWANCLKVAKKIESYRIKLTEHSNLPSPSITHFHLRRLYLPSTAILTSIELPALSELYFTHTSDSIMEASDLQTLVDFVQRSQCMLSRLMIRNMDIRDRSLLESLLSQTPSLKYLYVSDEPGQRVQWSLICTMLISDTINPMLPALEELVLHSQEPKTISIPSPSTLSRLINSRSKTPQCPCIFMTISSSLLPLGLQSLELDEIQLAQLVVAGTLS